MSACKVGSPLHEGKNLTIGSKEIELERSISKESFLSGSCFSGSDVAPLTEIIPRFKAPNKFTLPSPMVGNGTSSATFKPLVKRPIPDEVYALSEPRKPDAALSEITNEPSHWAANWYIPDHSPL